MTFHVRGSVAFPLIAIITDFPAAGALFLKNPCVAANGLAVFHPP
jgi:hypothetical protein